MGREVNQKLTTGLTLPKGCGKGVTIPGEGETTPAAGLGNKHDAAEQAAGHGGDVSARAIG